MSKEAKKTDNKSGTGKVKTPEISPKEEIFDDILAAAVNAVQRNPAGGPPSHYEILAVQQTAGNRAAGRLIREKRGLDSGSLQRIDQAAVRPPCIQRLGVYPYLIPAEAEAPSEMAVTPAQQVEALPEEVQQRHQTLVAEDNFQGALDVVVQAMLGEGQIEHSLIQTEPDTSRRQAVCHGTNCFVVDDGVSGASTIYCRPIEVAARNLPNPRVRINPSVVRTLLPLQSTILHEYRHIEQNYSEINQEGGATSADGHRLNCNDPGEMDAYLAEVEHAYEQSDHLLQSFSRVYVTNEYLAPEQQAVFRARMVNAQAKVDRLFGTTIEWRTNNHVVAYRAEAERIIESYERRVQQRNPEMSRPFYVNDPMAPLNADTPREGTRGTA